MAINSKQKGSRGERAAAKYLSELLGISLRRSVQYKGSPTSADIEPETGTWKLHPEIKNSQSVLGVKLYKAIAQAKSECGDKIPFVMSKRNYEDWLIVIPAEHIIEFAEEIIKIKNST